VGGGSSSSGSSSLGYPSVSTVAGAGAGDRRASEASSRFGDGVIGGEAGGGGGSISSGKSLLKGARPFSAGERSSTVTGALDHVCSNPSTTSVDERTTASACSFWASIASRASMAASSSSAARFRASRSRRRFSRRARLLAVVSPGGDGEPWMDSAAPMAGARSLKYGLASNFFRYFYSNKFTPCTTGRPPLARRAFRREYTLCAGRTRVVYLSFLPPGMWEPSLALLAKTERTREDTAAPRTPLTQHSMANTLLYIHWILFYEVPDPLKEPRAQLASSPTDCVRPHDAPMHSRRS
jgi:hypothetical protein